MVVQAYAKESESETEGDDQFREQEEGNGLSQWLEQDEEVVCAPCGEGIVEEEGEEGREAKTARAPHRVSSAEREHHELTHTPFRQWCEFCVKGRAANDAHHKKSEQDKKRDKGDGVPRLSAFLAQRMKRQAGTLCW